MTIQLSRRTAAAVVVAFLALAAVATTSLVLTLAGRADASHRFNDIQTGTFFHESTAWLADNGIADGFPDGSFRPNANITRGQASFWFSNYNDSLDVPSILRTNSAAGGDLSGPFANLQLQPNSVGTNEIANNSVTGTDVNESTLSVVPNATNATNASNATNATNATNAGTLGGILPSGFVSTGSPAGGDLNGTYPDPGIAPNVITGAEVANRSLGLADVAVANSAQTAINFPSIPAQSCVDTTVNVAGVLGTDVVLVTPPPTLPAGVLVGTIKASGNGQIVVRACNVGSSASADPANAAMSFAVFR